MTRMAERVWKVSELIRQINATNAVSVLPDGRTVTAALAERDVLRSRHAFLTSVADAASGQDGGRGRVGAPVRQMRSELKYITAVDVRGLRDEANDVARRHRELDAQIQQLNWTVDLVED